jgi:hypothetical protein
MIITASVIVASSGCHPTRYIGKRCAYQFNIDIDLSYQRNENESSDDDIEKVSFGEKGFALARRYPCWHFELSWRHATMLEMIESKTDRKESCCRFGFKVSLSAVGV